MEKKISEQIKSFLDFIDECRELNSMAYSGVGEEDKRHQDLTHAIEFEHDPEKIDRIGRRIHQNRIERRVYKDIYEITSPVVESLQGIPRTKRHWTRHDSFSGRCARWKAGRRTGSMFPGSRRIRFIFRK